MDQRLQRHEHLKSRKLIGRIFKEGKLIKAYPIMLFYLQDEALELSQPQVGFSVPAKKIRMAVDRNLLKRRMREAYRLHRNEHNWHEITNTAAMLVYVKNEPASFEELEKSVIKAFGKLATRDLHT